MREPNVAIVGATGLVGREFIKVLDERRFPMASIHLFASDRSVGKRLQVNRHEVEVQGLTDRSFKGIDLALFSAGGEVSRKFSPVAAGSNAVVVDNSKAFRMEPTVPLVVPEVNLEDVWKHQGIIANPNCSTIQLVVALNPIHKVNPIKRVIVDTYQSVSGIGAGGVEELAQQTKAILKGESIETEVFPHQIAFNVLPEIDTLRDNGYYNEEWKLVQETRKIMHAPDLPISATAVRVPVFVGHSEAVHMELTHSMTPEEVREILGQAPGVEVVDEPASHGYPLAIEAAGADIVYVGRIRKDASHPKGIAMWVVGDNVRKGAALNAVQIAEILVSGRKN
ncbi:MAG: aspartate-semialdehyde dehydrogenase [Dehalococcoidia bacterium]